VALKGEDGMGKFPLHEAGPWDWVLIVCNPSYFHGQIWEIAEPLRATKENILGQPVGDFWVSEIVV